MVDVTRILTVLTVIHSLHSYTIATSEIDRKWKLQSDFCTITEMQWKLIEWYFERVPYIEVTEIIENGANRHNHSAATQFTNNAVKELEWRIKKKIHTQTVDFATEDRVSNTQTYGWRGWRFPSRENATKPVHNLVVFRDRDDAESIRKRLTFSNSPRDDSPTFGGLVFVECSDLVDNYLTGYPRPPFKHQRANFVIIAYKLEENLSWDETAGRILTRLWKRYGILNAIILSTCHSDQVGYFDPFVNVLAQSTSGLKGWGTFKWVPINLLNYQDNWLLRKEYSLNGFPITASLFARNPTVVTNDKLPPFFLENYFNRGSEYSTGISGFDGLVLGNLASVLNFKTKVIMPLSGSYGSRQRNNTYSGSIGDILYGRADISFNGRFIQEYDSTEIEFMFSTNADKMCVIAPAAERVPQWMAIFKCYNVYVWILLPVVTSICGGFWFLLKYWNYKKRQCYYNGNSVEDVNDGDNDTDHYNDGGRHDENVNVCRVLGHIWMIMLGATTTMPMQTMERLFVGSCLLTNLIIIGTFQGSLTTSYSTVSYYKNIATLSALDESGLHIVTSSPSLAKLFGDVNDTTPLLKSLIKKFHIFEIDDQLNRTAFQRDICSIERYSDITVITKTLYQRSDGSAFVYVIDECPRHYFLSYIVKKGWPLLSRFNYILSKFSEAGLLNVWYQQVENAFVVHHLITNRHIVDKTQALTFSDIQTAFYILCIGLLGCIITFIIETFVMPRSNFLIGLCS